MVHLSPVGLAHGGRGRGSPLSNDSLAPDALSSIPGVLGISWSLGGGGED